MATVAEIHAKGYLEEYDLPDWEARSPVRSLLVAPALFTWVEQTPGVDDGTIVTAARTPLDHLEQFFSDLRCSERPSTSEFRRMMPTARGVWKCHPPTLRVFGWCYAPWSFVAVSAELERTIKTTPSLYASHMKGVLDFVKLHKLEGSLLRGDHLAIFPKT